MVQIGSSRIELNNFESFHQSPMVSRDELVADLSTPINGPALRFPLRIPSPIRWAQSSFRRLLNLSIMLVHIKHKASLGVR